MKLTPGFTVIDYQATPNGYYSISFRSTDGRTVIATQTGRGGCNSYVGVGGILPQFDVWLGANDGIAIDQFDTLGFHDLAVGVAQRENEWQDTVVLAIANAIELGVLSVEG